jgi:hypothetical protein
MTEEDQLIKIVAAVETAIKVTVNGKIDRLTNDVAEIREINTNQNKIIKIHNDQHEADMAEIKPMLELYTGSKIVGIFLRIVGQSGAWLLGLAVTYLTFKQLIK